MLISVVRALEYVKTFCRKRREKRRFKRALYMPDGEIPYRCRQNRSERQGIGQKEHNRLPPAPCSSRLARSPLLAPCAFAARAVCCGRAPARCLRYSARPCRPSDAVAASTLRGSGSRRLRPCRAADGAERARSASPPRSLPFSGSCVLLAARASPCASSAGGRFFGRVGGVCGSASGRLAPFPPPSPPGSFPPSPVGLTPPMR